MKIKKKINIQSLEYKQLLQISRRAEKQAKKFIEKNVRLNPSEQVKYTL